jgi:two-component system sensor histidine kinase ChvG
VIEHAKDFIKRHWPALRLREILLAVLLFAAAMPAIEAVWLRGYENTLVRQSEAELIAQGVALSASAGALWRGPRLRRLRPPSMIRTTINPSAARST